MNGEVKQNPAGKVSSGVEELIERLREEGVAAGRAEAERIEQEAKDNAGKMIAEAKARAEQIVADAEAEVQRLKQGGEDALNIAMRDVVLKLKAKLTDTVGEQVRRLISAELAREDFLKQLILEVAGRAREAAGVDRGEKIKILLPRELVGLEELRRHPLELHEGSLSHFILNVAADVLREGVTFGEAEDGKGGLRIYLEDREVQIDLTEDKVAEVLLEHLQPRFRAILEGTVK